MLMFRYSNAHKIILDQVQNDERIEHLNICLSSNFAIQFSIYVFDFKLFHISFKFFHCKPIESIVLYLGAINRNEKTYDSAIVNYCTQDSSEVERWLLVRCKNIGVIQEP